jgi:hypothetical protein
LLHSEHLLRFLQRVFIVSLSLGTTRLSFNHHRESLDHDESA